MRVGARMKASLQTLLLLVWIFRLYLVGCPSYFLVTCKMLSLLGDLQHPSNLDPLASGEACSHFVAGILVPKRSLEQNADGSLMAWSKKTATAFGATRLTGNGSFWAEELVVPISFEAARAGNKGYDLSFRSFSRRHQVRKAQCF